MPIQQGDIQFVKSQVMDDVPEGGKGPTGIVIPNGQSNAIFPDVSESDRVIGNVRLRKVVLWIRSNNVDTFLGSNIIVARPPSDPNVTVLMFHTGNLFDTRAEAVSRLEAYLSIGPYYAATLYGNHIAGQSTLLMYQKTDVLPSIGGTLVLTKREGFEDQVREYVRITEASSVLREFEDETGKYERYVVTLKLQNVLENDFGGYDVQRFEYTQAQMALKTRISDTVVADAARYYGTAALTEAGSIGDFTIKVASMFAQLVPSAQVETPIANARTNQLSTAVVSAGAPVTLIINTVFTTTQNLFIGGAVTPGSLLISGGGVDVDDTGGRLMLGGAQVGIVDYENGVASLTSNAFGTGGLTLTVTYSPAAVPPSVNQSQGIPVTAEGRATNYVRTIEPPPVPGTLSISYSAGRRWYVLRDDGSGALRGSESAYGAGNIIDGTFSVTLGALPDVGTSIIVQWVEPAAARDSDVLTLDNDGRFYWPFNTSGASTLDAGDKAIEPGGLTITWNDGSPRTATDDGAGNLTGDATGTVFYARGAFRFSPNVLPAPGTTINVSLDSAAKTAATVTIAGGAGSFGVTGIAPGSVEFVVTGQPRGNYLGTFFDWGGPVSYRVTDDGVGGLRLHIGDTTVAAGAINYAAGTFTLTANIALTSLQALAMSAWDNVYLLRNKPQWTMDVAVI